MNGVLLVKSATKSVGSAYNGDLNLFRDGLEVDMQNSTWRLGALLIILTLLSAGCGQKGDLYKPERNQQSSFSSQPAD